MSELTVKKGCRYQKDIKVSYHSKNYILLEIKYDKCSIAYFCSALLSSGITLLLNMLRYMTNNYRYITQKRRI